MEFRFEGLAIVSEDGMLADAAGVMPPALLVDADQKFLSSSLDRAAVLVHGRNSHENHHRSRERWRLIATRKVATAAAMPGEPRALLWNPAGLSFERATGMLGISGGIAAILGGTEIFGLFLSRFDAFHLSRIAGVRLPGGRAVLPQVPQFTPEQVLTAHGMVSADMRMLDAARGVSLTTWERVRTPGGSLT